MYDMLEVMAQVLVEAIKRKKTLPSAMICVRRRRRGVVTQT